MTELSRDEAEAFVQAVVQLASMADRALPQRSSPLTRRLSEHLGGVGDDVSSTSMSVPVVERVNVQLALDAFAASTDRFDVIGLQSDIGNYGGVSLTGMVTGSWHGPGEAARQYVAVDIGVGESIDCLKSGLVLTGIDGEPVVALMYASENYRQELIVEVVGATQAAADGFLARLRELMHEHNAFRGKVVAFSFGMHGEFGLTFVKLPAVGRDDVVLGPGELEAIEAHSIGITEHADGLRAAGQHVKRGLLLYGPPGTGKTHTISYLVGAMRDRTTIILAGGAVGAVGQAGTIARSLQPATIVIEDVDLIAMDRQLPGGDHNALLFQLLNEMDGLAEDADVLFVLTTNRVEMLEPALAARPGRIDQAIEISLPDARARRRLVELYTRRPLDPHNASDDDLVERLDGVAPAFIKELARRAQLVELRGEESSSTSSLVVALDAMLEHATPVLRRSLAGPADD
ncbi:MAG: AAA family ATPase [Ilumatobacter sp.]|uniref:AAA family ATPase n=1 Tax=Ilumatobacter sp. TaxID=1967498 RepID=UPI00391AF249